VKKVKNYNVAAMQPDELNEIKKLAGEFITRMNNIENEIEMLNDDKRELVEEFEDKLDIKTLKLAMRVAKIQKSVAHKDTYDMFVQALEKLENE
jgi:uncharacterized protein (UPF0335 family)